MPDTTSQSLSETEIAEAAESVLGRKPFAYEVALAEAILAKQREMDAKAEPRTYYFHRFVDGQKMAEDVEVELADSEQEAIATALRICPKRPMTVLVLTHPPAAQDREPITPKMVLAAAACHERGRVVVSTVQRVLRIGYVEAATLCKSIMTAGLVDGLEVSPAIDDAGIKEPQR